MKGITSTTMAGSFALAAFAVAVLAGLASGNAAASVLMRAVIAMIACYPVGLAAGVIAQRLVLEHVEAHRRANPEPDDEEAASGDAGDVDLGVTDGDAADADEEVLVV
jgi:hypothetical protein